MKKTFIAQSCLTAVAIAVVVSEKSEMFNEAECNALMLANVEALTSPSEPGLQNQEPLWIRTDGNCVYTAKGKAGAKTTLNIIGVGVITLTFNSSGEASYTAEGGKTDCEAGGKQQCTARYCPVDFWN